jgi:hypothetical protein
MQQTHLSDRTKNLKLKTKSCAKRSKQASLRVTFSFYLLVFSSMYFFPACSDGDNPAINGMWQLKTIESPNHIQAVDTVFYAFQRQSIFSYTRLQEKENPPHIQIYGFIDFPASDRLHIQLDKRYYQFAPYVPWKDTAVIYDIIRLDAKRLILSENDTVYYFNKY